MKEYNKPTIQKMHVRSYINHMGKNLHIAVHMAGAGLEHLIHAIFPAYEMRHD